MMSHFLLTSDSITESPRLEQTLLGVHKVVMVLNNKRIGRRSLAARIQTMIVMDPLPWWELEGEELQAFLRTRIL